ncbi:MAG: glycosyltransferase family 2 protein [Synechococcales cyanobacterium C42_A2020_086]|jgi:GT2 family glycosyltransferase|nr:glycosyltransferase family 2 protein [Synechococcales cyanobacterium C42_A2020_086]
MTRISIGISIYNNSSNVKNLINSIRSLTNFPEKYNIVVCDDGSDESVSRSLIAFCDSLAIPYIQNINNKGVPYSWNRLTEYYDTEYMIILNDDTRVIHKNWLAEVVFALDNNPEVGIVDWRENIIDFSGNVLKQTSSYHGKLPKAKLKPSGPFFAFRKNVWKTIKQPDGSTGFWEDLTAYREEMDLAAEFASRGFYTMQLPFYMEHFKSQTFNGNPDSRLRKTYSDFLTEEEFWGEFYTYSQLDIEVKKENSKPKERFKRFFPWKALKKQLPTKLEYSRAMFAKKWKNRNLFNMPGEKFLKSAKSSQKAFLQSIQGIKILYLDSEMNVAEAHF